MHRRRSGCVAWPGASRDDRPRTEPRRHRRHSAPRREPRPPARGATTGPTQVGRQGAERRRYSGRICRPVWSHRRTRSQSHYPKAPLIDNCVAWYKSILSRAPASPSAARARSRAKTRRLAPRAEALSLIGLAAVEGPAASDSRGPGNGILWAETGGRFRTSGSSASCLWVSLARLRASGDPTIPLAQQHVQGQPSHAGGRVEGLGHRDEGDTVRVEQLDQLGEVGIKEGNIHDFDASKRA